MKSIVGPLIAVTLLAGGCNSDHLQGIPKASETPTPTPGPGGDLPPIAVIAGESVIAPGQIAAFDGGGSSDPDGTVVGYSWTLTARPAGSAAVVTTSSGNAAHASVNADVAGDYTLQLTVTDDAGLTGSSSITFGAVPSSPTSLRVELKWPSFYGKADLDNHLVDVSQGGTGILEFNGTWDCFYGNCVTGAPLAAPDWFTAGLGGDDPHLDGDNVTQAIPENIVIDQPHDPSVYEIGIHYYCNHVNPSPTVTAYTVSVYVGTNLVWSPSSVPALSRKQLWRAAKISWSGGAATVTPITPTTLVTTTNPCN